MFPDGNLRFDLEKAIAAWRRTFEHHHSFFKEDVEELERHVRDHVAWLVAQGSTEAEAFHEAVRRVGDYGSTEAEYRKVFWEKIRHQRGSMRELIWEITMLKNYLKIALRNLRRYKGYTAINVSGLAVGTACCLLILLFVRDELSYDRHHDNADRIVRVLVGEAQTFTPTIIGPLFTREFPEVETAARLYPLGMFRPVVIRYGERAFEESRFFYADSTVFDVFTLPFVAGTPHNALNRPETLVLTATTARKYFGRENPVGKVVQVGSGVDYEVTGVIEDLPSTSHVQFDVLGSFASTHWAGQEIWNSANFYTFLLLQDEQALASLQAKVTARIDEARRNPSGGVSADYFLTLQPLTDIHLYFEGRITYVYLFAALAVLILLVACANYMNLATARSARRAREVGVRKMAGAHRRQLAFQFFGESAVLVFGALVLAVLLAEVLLPIFNGISGKALAFRYLDDPVLVPALLGVGVAVSLVAGGYPALLLSSFRPAQVLKGALTAGVGGASFRKILVIFQLAVTVFLIAGTMIVYRQLDYMRTKNLGFDKEQVVVLSIGDRVLRETHTTLKNEILQHPNVRHASAIHSIPGYQRSGYGMRAEGINMEEGEAILVGGIPSDADVVETLGLDLLTGAGFPKSEGYTPEPGNYVYLVNETLLGEAGWTADNAIGRRINLLGNREGEVVGVFKDYHFLSLHQDIHPLAFFIEPRQFAYLMVKITPNDVPGTLAAMEATWQRLAPHRPFVYRFLDQEFDALYRTDRQTGQILSAFAGLAVLIACLGLFGLASFAAEQRTKEIGVRKVLGASASQIVVLLTKDLARLVVVAFVVAAPLAFLVMNRWLESFAYRVDMLQSWWIFLLAGVATLVVAFLTVSYQSIRAALANPALSLRYE